MKVLATPQENSSSSNVNPHLSVVVKKIFGPSLGRFLICHMVSKEGVGIELFEFLQPRSQNRVDGTNFEYWKTGFFHIAITEPRIEALARRVAEAGGKQRTEVLELVPGSGKKICFCEDPFGNIIEIYSHSYEDFWTPV